MKTKKTIASALALTLLASMSTSVVSAAGEIGLQVTKAEAKVGETFTLDVMLSDVPTSGFSSAEFSITYDSSIVKVTDVKAGTIANTGSDEKESDVSSEVPTFAYFSPKDGTINVSWGTGLLDDSSCWVSKDGTFLTITGTVNSTASVGDVSEFDVKPIERSFVNEKGETVSNKDITFGALSVNGDDISATSYPVSVVNGSVTVVDSGESDDATYGDVNVDGKINLTDVIYLNKFIAGSYTPSPQGQINAACDQTNSDIDLDDTLALLKYLIKVVELPVK
ncbi:MAG: hypothetical protein IJZ64_00215 [Ruminococcus sp.]|nr:hypothetical protein [Ruminococcus sp.]